jgi:DNA-nicking Smr family endonuclease
MKDRDRDPLSDEDREQFLDAIGPVRRLPERAPPPSADKPAPRTRMAERDEAEAREAFRHLLDADALEAGDALRYRRDEVPPRVLRRLSRGEYAAQDELDLHHADSAQAEALLRAFLKAARDAEFGCVRIVHGKGVHGDSRLPVLKNLTDRWLRQRADVLAFHSAPPAQGGNGAVLVLLKPRRA